MRACAFAPLLMYEPLFTHRHDPQRGMGRHQRRGCDKAEWASALAAGNPGSCPSDKGHSRDSPRLRPSGSTGRQGPAAAPGQSCLKPAGAHLAERAPRNSPPARVEEGRDKQEWSKPEKQIQLQKERAWFFENRTRLSP